MFGNIARVSTAAHAKRGFGKKEIGRIPTAAHAKRGRLSKTRSADQEQKVIIRAKAV